MLCACLSMDVRAGQLAESLGRPIFRGSRTSPLVARRGAVLFVAIGVMFFVARDAEPSPARSSLCVGFMIGCATRASLGIFELASGHARLGILSAVIVELTLAAVFLWLAAMTEQRLDVNFPAWNIFLSYMDNNLGGCFRSVSI